MHKLDRTGIEAPQCLENYDYQAQNWDQFGGACKKQLRQRLEVMQGQPVPGEDGQPVAWINIRCAYCEVVLCADSHIEHFRRKRYFKELTFAWHNLFLSCDDEFHCGHFKDRRDHQPYNPDLLIKPDEDDPDHFLFFHSSGEVRPRFGLSAADEVRAKETIRVFGLYEPTLMGLRKKAVDDYRKRNYFDEVLSWPDELISLYIEEEIEITRWAPHSTAIKHFLQIRAKRPEAA